MTREEEIRQVAEKLYSEWICSKTEDDNYSFVDGVLLRLAQWVDEHPKQKEEHQRGLCGNMIN